MPLPRRSTILVAAAILLLPACKGESKGDAARGPQSYGEPIGARVDAAGEVPAFEMAFAVTKGRDPQPLLSPLVSTMTAAVKGCPDFVAEAKSGDAAGLDFSLEGGAVKLREQEANTNGARCLTKAMAGKGLLPANTPPVDVRVEIRLAEAAPAGSAR
jgi:hypothetical protein